MKTQRVKSGNAVKNRNEIIKPASEMLPWWRFEYVRLYDYLLTLFSEWIPWWLSNISHVTSMWFLWALKYDSIYSTVVYLTCVWKEHTYFSIMLSSKADTGAVLFRSTVYLAVCYLLDLPFNKDDFLNVWCHMFIIIHLLILPSLFSRVLAMHTWKHPRLRSKQCSIYFARFPLFPPWLWVLDVSLGLAFRKRGLTHIHLPFKCWIPKTRSTAYFSTFPKDPWFSHGIYVCTHISTYVSLCFSLLWLNIWQKSLRKRIYLGLQFKAVDRACYGSGGEWLRGFPSVKAENTQEIRRSIKHPLPLPPCPCDLLSSPWWLLLKVPPNSETAPPIGYPLFKQMNLWGFSHSSHSGAHIHAHEDIAHWRWFFYVWLTSCWISLHTMGWPFN